MGLSYTEITLIDVLDVELERRQAIKSEGVKELRVNALVDTGSITLSINEKVQIQLQLPLVRKGTDQTADSRIQQLDVVGPYKVKFKNRKCNTSAFVLPGDSEVLSGAIPLEEMDVLIHPHGLDLFVNPYISLLKLK